MKESRILIVCSSLDYILIEKLLSASFQLDYAPTYDVFLALKRTNKYDLLLLDVVFLETEVSLAENRTGQPPIIGLSSDPYDARKDQLKKRGCWACYIKPIRQELFAPFVKYWMDRYYQENG